MASFGGRLSKKNTPPSSYIASSNIQREEKILGRIQKQYSREEDKIRKQLQNLQVEKLKRGPSSHRELGKSIKEDLHGVPSQLGYPGHQVGDRRSHHKHPLADRSRSRHMHHGGKDDIHGKHPEEGHHVRNTNGGHHVENDHHGKNKLSAEESGLNAGRKRKSTKLPLIDNGVVNQQPMVPEVKLTIDDTHDSTSSLNRSARSSRDSIDSGCSLTKALKNNPTASIRSFYNEAIKKLSRADVNSRGSDPNQELNGGGSKSSMDKLPELDRNAYKELEGIIREAKLQGGRRESVTNYASRHKKRRLQHLEQLLEELRPRIRHEIPFDPQSILECRYLRLSKANITQLEKMVEESGKDPGIHAHSDVTNYNIWK